MATTTLNVPIGAIIDYAGSGTPPGYLECDGSAVSRTTYASLFAAIGTAWGSGNGSTTFNLPNLGGRVAIGKGSRTLGSTGGSETHTLTESEMPSHTHAGRFLNAWTPNGHGSGNWFHYSAYHWGSDQDYCDIAGPVLPAGGGAAHSIMQPYAVVRKLIRAA